MVLNHLSRFLSTLSLRRATDTMSQPGCATLFLSTLSLRRATASAFLIGSRSQFLSTLSLRRATALSQSSAKSTPISIHALLAESDLVTAGLGNLVGDDFYPRSPCGERRMFTDKRHPEVLISIHALLAESDLDAPGVHDAWHISIHALLAESDDHRGHDQPRNRHFYPRSPCGERPPLLRLLPCGAANFYPRSPCGERHPVICTGNLLQHFYPRSPCGERRWKTMQITANA